MVTCSRRFVSRSNISRYFDHFMGQRLWYDVGIMLNDLRTSELKMLSLKLGTAISVISG